MTVRSAILMGLMLLGGCGADAQAPKAAMELTGRVVDQANLIDDGLESQLTARLLRLERETGVQMVIATTPSLGGRTIKAYGLDLANAWGVGSKARNDGLVLLVAPVERKVRIEVGYGLEAGMTNALCDEIIQRSIVPHFRTGDMPGGILTGTDAIISAIAKQRPAQRKAA
ncbi:TPM domain-containing protein [Sphingobium limneticum]|uniref:TPM domain-containing protein n=2 Tax=Sphingobium limneticum TaxID=1007511 RepID=A0A5J5IAE2_9SPHN|nr:TPM domain-containing protein [Sphingobium limneticum]KAA9033224.1 TPM domain-containing protein [Sphingobium limneticum]